jgi:hypothetical protein
VCSSDLDGIPAEIELVEKPLYAEKHGLQRTASGYGAKLPSRWIAKTPDGIRRVYVTIYSNAGTAWFNYRGGKVVVD